MKDGSTFTRCQVECPVTILSDERSDCVPLVVRQDGKFCHFIRKEKALRVGRESDSTVEALLAAAAA